MNQYFVHDARKIKDLPLKSRIDLIITSPPYFDMKDYGSKNQIGFGQDYPTYLNDLGLVFEQCYKVTKDTGSLWIIVDILRKDGKIKILPFDVIQKVEQSGWKLQDIIIWKKDKTVPFTHYGHMRNISEYILFFTKSDKFKFYRERVTSINDLKEWWQRYPERYSPIGKSPTNIWEFPIPLQGSWGTRYVKHFCPLPEDLIERIIHLCSDINDTVFDPFAGSGAVLSAAYRLKRKYVGSDLNESYRAMFLKYIKKIKPINIKAMYSHDVQKQFSQTITKLRLLKFPKTLYSLLQKNNSLSISGVIVLPKLFKKVLPKNKLISCEYIFISDNDKKLFLEAVEKVIRKAPLSKFGIDSRIKLVSPKGVTQYINRYFSKKKIWRYDNGITYRRGLAMTKEELKKTLYSSEKKKNPTIYSTLELSEKELLL